MGYPKMSKQSQNQTPAAYALISARGSGKGHRVALPARIGASGASDIIVNVQALPDHAFTLTAGKGGLVLVREPNGQPVSLGMLKNLGLSAKGPIRGSAEVGGTGRLIREALGKEQAWFANLPTAARRWTLGFLPQPLRLLAWGGLLAGAVTLAAVQEERAPTDLSEIAVELKFDTVKSDTLGANPKNPDFMKGYENGVTFAVDVPKAQQGKALLLTFDLAGLNIGKELTLGFNGKGIYQTAAESACAQDVCAKSIRVDGKHVKSGENLIRFVHNNPESSYFVGKVHLRPLPGLSDLESQQLDHWYTLAQRAYEERGIVPENLVTAKTHVGKLTKLASERDGVSQILPKAKILEQEIDKAFAATTGELWTAYGFAEKLGNKADMEAALNQLLKLHPNARSEEHADIVEKLQALKEPKNE